jgi:hypothetical protein
MAAAAASQRSCRGLEQHLVRTALTQKVRIALEKELGATALSKGRRERGAAGAFET